MNVDRENKQNLDRILQGKDPKKKLQVGFDSIKKEPTRYGHNPGDVWEEHGKKWKMTKEGNIQNITKMDSYRVPVFCPECGHVMKGEKDTKSFYAHGTCLNCLVDYHEFLRKEGKLDQFAFRKRLLSSISWFKEQQNQFDDFKKVVTENPEFVFSDGRVEKWSNELDSEKLIGEYKEFLTDYKNKLNNSIKKYEQEYGEKLDEWKEPTRE